jgi:hypothetical protein
LRIDGVTNKLLVTLLLDMRIKEKWEKISVQKITKKRGGDRDRNMLGRKKCVLKNSKNELSEYSFTA